MIHYDRLLVPVDGSDASHGAASQALALAGETAADVDVLHVVEEGTGDRERLEDRGRQFLVDVEELAEGAGLDVTAELRTGTPHRAILEYAEERGTHLVVMGRHGTGTIGERLLGGVAERVLRAGALPVLTVWADGADDGGVVGAGRVLLPTDGSGPAEAAAEHASAIADVSGATVHVVSVADVDAAGGLFDVGGLSEEFVENVEDRSRAATDRLAGDLERAGRPVETAVLRGAPADALRAYVEENGIDAIVMGAHGRSGIARWMLGSVTERVLRTVEVPVLVVPGR